MLLRAPGFVEGVDDDFLETAVEVEEEEDTAVLPVAATGFLFSLLVTELFLVLFDCLSVGGGGSCAAADTADAAASARFLRI